MSDDLILTFDYTGLQKALQEKLAALKNRQPLMRELADIMHSAVEDNFKDEGRPRWLPLSPAYLQRRRKQAGGNRIKILQKSGRLAASISTSSDNNTAVAGTNVGYAKYQQYGATIPAHTQRVYFKRRRDGSMGNRFVSKAKADIEQTAHHKARHIPARPFLQLTPVDTARIREAVRVYFAEKISG